MHMWSLHLLDTEIVKVIKSISPPTFNELFHCNGENNWNLRNPSEFVLSKKKTIFSELKGS